MISLISSIWSNVKAAVQSVVSTTKTCATKTVARVKAIARTAVKRVKAAWVICKLVPIIVYAAVLAVVDTLSLAVSGANPNSNVGKVVKHATQLTLYVLGCAMVAVLIYLPMLAISTVFDTVLNATVSAVPADLIVTMLAASPMGVVAIATGLVALKAALLIVGFRGMVTMMQGYNDGVSPTFVRNAYESVLAAWAFVKRAPQLVSAIYTSVLSFGTRLRDRAIDVTIETSVRVGFAAIKRYFVKTGALAV